MKTGFFTSLSGTLRNTDMNYTRYLLLLFGVMALASCRQEAGCHIQFIAGGDG